MKVRPILLFVVNEAYFFVSHRLPVALEARRRGYDVHIAAPRDNVWAPDGYSVDELDETGLTFHEIPISRRGISPVQELRTFFALFRLYRRLRPQIVHHLTIKPNVYGGLAARLVGVPSVVFAVTGLGQLFVSKHVGMRIIKLFVSVLMRLAYGHSNKRVIVQNKRDREFLINCNIIELDDTVLIPGSGVDLNLFKPKREPVGDPVVILPARLIWEKGVQEFVDAAKLLQAEGVSARFVLVGGTHPSNPRSVPEITLRDWAEKGVIEWWGRREDMHQVMAACHIVCLPSKYGEGVPKVLLEAAAAGRPVVVTDTAGCREVVDDCVEGFLVPAGSGRALANALRRLIRSPDKREIFGQAARRKAEAYFAIESIVQTTLEIYEELRAP